MKREHVSFAVAGVIFGFLLGFVIAHEMYGGRFAAVASGAGAAPPPAPMGARQSAGPADEPAAPHTGAMDQVTQELNALKQAIQNNPGDAVALGRLGGLYMDAGMYEQAIDYFSRAVEVNPSDVHLRTEMATALLMMGKAREALAELEGCVELDPAHGKTWYWKGLAHVELGEYEKGEASFAKALELMPGAFNLEELQAEIERIKAQRGSEGGGATPS